MLKKIVIILVSLLFVQIFFSCSSINTADSKNDNDSKVWTEIDSEIIADSIVSNLLASEWNTKFSTKRKPKLIVGSIDDLTDEKIDTDLLSKNIERSFINSGNVTFISSKSKREEARNDRMNENDFEGKKEFQKYLKPLKADFFICGNIKLVVDSVSVQKLKEYELTLKVIKTKNLESVATLSEIIIK